MNSVDRLRNGTEASLRVEIRNGSEVIVSYGWYFNHTSVDKRAKAFASFFENFHETQLAVKDEQITKFSFGDLEISKASLNFIALLLMRFHNLEMLAISGDSCRSYWPHADEISFFYEAVAKHKSLVSLVLQNFGYLWNPIPLFDAIDSSSVSELDLSKTSLKCSKKIVERIILSVGQNKTLTRLNIECNPFEVNIKGEYRLYEFDWKVFESALKENTSLVHLVLPYNFNISSAFIKEIVSRNKETAECSEEISSEPNSHSPGTILLEPEEMAEPSPKKQRV